MAQRAIGGGTLLLCLAISLFCGAQIDETPSSVIINEVAWGGATWDPTAEWIELFNTTSEPIDVSGWRLVSSDGSPNILLHGRLEPWIADASADAFLLLERAGDRSAPGVSADIIYAGALDDGGEALFLLDADGRVVDSANAPSLPNDITPWPAGCGADGASSNASMERIETTGSDTPSNWATWHSVDHPEEAANGTPKRRNSVFNIPPLASMSYEPARPVPGQPVQFDASASSDANDEIVSYRWMFGDTTTGEGAIVEHTYRDPGGYNVTLTVTDDTGRETNLSHLVRVLVTMPPTADFSIVPSFPERRFHALDTLGFQDESHDLDGNLVAWEWRFGDGTQADKERVFHQYQSPGDYVVWLAVTDDQGERAVQTRSISILSRPPVAHFTFAPDHPNQGQPVRVDASSSWDPDGEVAMYRWDFDDDGIIDLETTEAVTERAFAESGDYVIRLEVIDDEGVPSYPVDFDAGPLYRPPTVSVNGSPVALFSVSCFEPRETQVVSFTDASFDADGLIAAYEWDFGDGVTSTEPSPTHAYDVAGAVTVSLTVTDDHGAVHTTEAELRIANLSPSAVLSVDETSRQTDQTFLLDASASSDPSPNGSIVQVEWDFDGDGTYDRTTTATAITQSYDDDGQYTVRCRVTDNGGATDVSDSVTLEVTNRPPHVTRVSWSPKQPDDTEQVTFSGVGDDPDGDIARWFWTFCGGTIDGGSTVAYTFPTDGVFTVSLTVEDDDGERSDPHLLEVSIANAAPVARIALSRRDGRTIAFHAQDSYDPSPDGQIVHVAWDFGDGTTCPGTPWACGDGDRMAPVHFYSEPGTYIVTLVVVDEQGALSFAEQSIKIFE